MRTSRATAFERLRAQVGVARGHLERRLRQRRRQRGRHQQPIAQRGQPLAPRVPRGRDHLADFRQQFRAAAGQPLVRGARLRVVLAADPGLQVLLGLGGRGLEHGRGHIRLPGPFAQRAERRRNGLRLPGIGVLHWRAPEAEQLERAEPHGQVAVRERLRHGGHGGPPAALGLRLQQLRGRFPNQRVLRAQQGGQFLRLLALHVRPERGQLLLGLVEPGEQVRRRHGAFELGRAHAVRHQQHHRRRAVDLQVRRHIEIGLNVEPVEYELLQPRGDRRQDERLLERAAVRAVLHHRERQQRFVAQPAPARRLGMVRQPDRRLGLVRGRRGRRALDDRRRRWRNWGRCAVRRRVRRQNSRAEQDVARRRDDEPGPPVESRVRM